MANSHTLGTDYQPGCDEPTSRVLPKPPPSIWTLGRYQPVIPGYLLSVERWPFHSRTTGSLWPAFTLPARIVILAVKKRAYAIALTTRCPTVFSPPSCSPLLFGRRPPQSNYPPGCQRGDSGTNVRTSKLQGGISRTTPPHLATRFQKSHYPTHVGSMFSAKL